MHAGVKKSFQNERTAAALNNARQTRRRKKRKSTAVTTLFSPFHRVA